MNNLLPTWIRSPYSTYVSCLEAIINTYVLCYPGCFRNARLVIRLLGHVIAIVIVFTNHLPIIVDFIASRREKHFNQIVNWVNSCLRCNYYDYVLILHNYFLHWPQSTDSVLTFHAHNPFPRKEAKRNKTIFFCKNFEIHDFSNNFQAAWNILCFEYIPMK